LLPDFVVQIMELIKLRGQGGIQKIVFQHLGHIGIKFVRIADDPPLMLAQPSVQELEAFDMCIRVLNDLVSLVFDSTGVFTFDNVV